MSLGDRIRSIRESQGLSLTDLARRMDTTPSNIQRWEQDRVSPRYKTLQRIAGL